MAKLDINIRDNYGSYMCWNLWFLFIIHFGTNILKYGIICPGHLKTFLMVSQAMLLKTQDFTPNQLSALIRFLKYLVIAKNRLLRPKLSNMPFRSQDTTWNPVCNRWYVIKNCKKFVIRLKLFTEKTVKMHFDWSYIYDF